MIAESIVDHSCNHCRMDGQITALSVWHVEALLFRIRLASGGCCALTRWVTEAVPLDQVVALLRPDQTAFPLHCRICVVLWDCDRSTWALRGGRLLLELPDPSPYWSSNAGEVVTPPPCRCRASCGDCFDEYLQTAVVLTVIAR